MRDKIIDLIKKEDVKNPLTDEEIARKLGIFRETVTVLRKEAAIPNSGERRKQLLSERIKEILLENPSISERGITRYLESEGFVVGKYTIGKIKTELLSKTEFQEELDRNKNKEILSKPDFFQSFVGSDGSLKQQILKAQAAVMYPPKGLHCLIYGPSGVGKSYLAELMHTYACGTENFGQNPPFFEFNCADYADNPQLLLAQLFGYNKGSFTGADKDHKGVVELCDGGILFLDEVHRLPPEGQEILFYLIDKGKFRRMGEVDTLRASNLMVIAATTENPQSSLLLTFRRRIPMIIEIPPLNERPARERLEIIRRFFSKESMQLNREFLVKEEVVRCLLNSDYAANVGQLKSDIQVCCAKAFLESKRKKTEQIEIYYDCLPETLKKDLADKKQQREFQQLQGDLLIYPDNKKIEEENTLLKNLDIYGRLEKSYDKMVQDGISEAEIRTWLTSEIEAQLTRNIREIEKSRFSSDEMENLVGAEIVKITKDIYNLAKKRFSDLKEELICPLAVHIWMTLQRNMQRNRSLVSGVYKVQTRYPEEYEAADAIFQEICSKYYLMLPEEEKGFIAMYLNRFRQKEAKSRERISVLVVSHGAVACGMAEVANAILGTDHAKGIEMNLTDSPTEMMEKVVRLASVLNCKRGILVLADMGSLMQAGDEIRKRLGVPVGIVGRCDTLMVIEAVRRTLWTDDTMEQIVEALDVKKTVTPVETLEKRKNPAILCLCITGEGGARVIKDYISERLKSNLNHVEIITRGYVEDMDVSRIIRKVEGQYEILAIVGTIDPEQEKYPFISITQMYQPEGVARLRKILKRRQMLENNQLADVIFAHHIFVRKDGGYKEDILDEMVGKLIEESYVEKDFLLSVYKRESMMPTVLQGGIAIPHGNSELVTKPVISITKLDTPIIWDGVNMVDLIFVLALDENSKKYFEQLYRIISDETMLSAIRKCHNSTEIEKILCENTKSDK